MEPKTKLQKRVVEVSKKLKALSPEQKAWAEKHVLKHIAFRSKRQTNCLDCGTQWKTGDSILLVNKMDKTCTCPGCGEQLKVIYTKQRIEAQSFFYTIIDRQDEFQVVRIFELRSAHKTGKAREVTFAEACRQFILPDGRYEIIARLRGGFVYDYFTGPLELRGKQSFFEKYNILPAGIYPKQRVLSIYKRNGFKGNFHGLTPHNLFTELGHRSQAETLLKRKELGFLAALCLGSKLRKEQVLKYWPSIRIAMRHEYKVTEKNVCDYLDHLELLEFFNEDLRSPHFVCPADFKKAKKLYIAKKQAVEEKLREEAKKAKIAEEEANYIKAKGIFFGVCFESGDISIQVLQSVNEVYEEGKALHHCVFANKYHIKDKSLLLSAKVAGERMETIEIDLEQFKIVQARGLQNKPSPHHDSIIKLLQSKMPEIKKIIKKQNRVAA